MKKFICSLIFLALCFYFAMLCFWGCGNRVSGLKKLNAEEEAIDCKILRHNYPFSNVVRIIDKDYGYIIYITNEGVTAVPLTDKK